MDKSFSIEYLTDNHNTLLMMNQLKFNSNRENVEEIYEMVYLEGTTLNNLILQLFELPTNQSCELV